MTFNVNPNATKTGDVLERTALDGAPLTSPQFDVSGLSRLSFGFIFEFGSGTLTRLGLVLSEGAGAAAADDFITVFAHGE